MVATALCTIWDVMRCHREYTPRMVIRNTPCNFYHIYVYSCEYHHYEPLSQFSFKRNLPFFLQRMAEIRRKYQCYMAYGNISVKHIFYVTCNREGCTSLVFIQNKEFRVTHKSLLISNINVKYCNIINQLLSFICNIWLKIEIEMKLLLCSGIVPPMWLLFSPL